MKFRSTAPLGALAIAALATAPLAAQTATQSTPAPAPVPAPATAPVAPTVAAPKTQSVPAPAASGEKEGSLYVQCDGQPNNVTGGERAARLLGAVTLLGLFAPPMESADASKRKFGAAGVAACTAQLEGEKAEGNPQRRVGLFLGRAIHRIEDKQYEAAIADARLARSEAEKIGLTSDPYFMHSRGRAFDLIEAAALYRMGKPADAREAALRTATAQSAASLVGVPAYLLVLQTGSEAEQRYYSDRTRLFAPTGRFEADRLDELGHFAEAAHIRDALVEFDKSHAPDLVSSVWLAQSAVSWALAGGREKAAARAAEARGNFDKRTADGKPEANAAEYVELLDLYGIIDTANGGDLKAARRLFAARSQWVAASFGAVVEVTRRLRATATPDELIGGLSHDPEQLWKDRIAARQAETLARDSDNKTLFSLMPWPLTASTYEMLSKQVWRTDKSSLLIKPKTPPTSKYQQLFLYGQAPTVSLDAYMLHAALLARSRGQQGFVLMPIVTEDFVAASFLTGNRGEQGLPDALFNDASAVIARLSPIIPDPETLKAIKEKRTASK